MLPRYLNKYNDTLLFIVLIPIINTINYHLTYARIRWDWYTYTTYAIDTATGFIAWWIIRETILWYDRRLPYLKAPIKRIGLQILMTNIWAQGFIILETEVLNALFGEGPLPTKFYTYNLFIFFIWILVINGIYIGIYFYDQWRKTASLRDQDKELRTKGFEVQLGKSVFTVDFDNILAFYVEEGFTYLKTRELKNYVVDASLNKVVPRLPEELFFRLNRRFVVNRHMIKAYHREVNGKLKVELLPEHELPNHLIVSRINAPDFKRWFKNTVQHS